MAKKVIVPENGDGKSPVVSKRRHRGLSCLLAFLITVLAICGIVFGIGWYFGDKYSKLYLEMPLSDTLGVMNELYWTKDKDVVKKPFSDDDLDGFYSEIKQNILLRSDAEVDFDAAIERAVSDIMKKEESAVGEVRNFSGGDEDGESESGGEIMNILVDMMASAFTRENIDMERLESYSEDADNYIFTLRDKELAAFVNNVLRMMLNEIDVSTVAGGFAMPDMDLNAVVKLKQIYFGAQSATNELGEREVTATTANITVWIGLEDLASRVAVTAVKDAGMSWLGGLVEFGIKTVLPKNVYATVTLPLQGEAQAQVSLNAMNEGKRDRMYHIINKILAIENSDGEPKTVQALLAEMADKIAPYMDNITGENGLQDAFDAAEQGNIKLDLLDMLAKAANGEDTDDPITKSDFMYLLQAVLTSDPDVRLEQLQPYLYEGWYVDGNGGYAYKPADTTGYVAVDYKNEFVNQLAEKYSLDVDGRSLDEVLAMLGVSLDGSEAAPDPMDMLDLVDGERFEELLGTENINDIKLTVTDRMLAAILNDKLGDMLKNGNSSFANLSIKLDALSFVGRAENPTHMYALLAVEVNIVDYIASVGDGNMLMAFATNVLPERLLLGIEVDITRSLDAGDAYSPTTLILNDYENTGRVLETLGKVVDGLDLSSMTESIETMLRNMTDTLYEKLDAQLVASDTTGAVVTQGAILMPDVFTLMTDLVLTDDGVRIVEPEEFKDVLRGLNEHGGFSDVARIAGDYSEFISDLKDKYYFNDVLDENGNEITDFTKLADAVGSDFSGDRLRIIPAAGAAPVSGHSYLAYDVRPVNELRPVMRDNEIALLVSEKLAESNGVSDFEVLEVTTGDDMLTLLLSVDVDDLLPANVGNLLNINKLYVTATVDMSRTVGAGEDIAYPVSVTVNNMDEATFVNAVKIINHIGNGSFDIESQVAEFGKILYSQLASLEESLGGEGVISFTENGLELIDFYGFLINKMWDEAAGERPSAETVKNAVQGMYPRSTVDGFVNPNNYVVGDIVVNGGAEMSFNGAVDSPSENKTAADLFIASFSVDLYDSIKTDREFNAYLDALMVRLTSERDMVRAVQTFAIDRTNTSDGAIAARNWLNDRLEGRSLKADGDYIAVTFRMAMDKFMITDSALTSGFLPDEMYATIVIEKTTDASGKAVFNELENGVIFNNMGADEYNALIKLMSLSADAQEEGSSKDKINIVTITGNSVKGLNGLTEATGAEIVFGTATADGVGTVAYKKET